ncbi:unnamed protein product [Ectocarpus sp. 4 AP-2014]
MSPNVYFTFFRLAIRSLWIHCNPLARPFETCMHAPHVADLLNTQLLLTVAPTVVPTLSCSPLCFTFLLYQGPAAAPRAAFHLSPAPSHRTTPTQTGDVRPREGSVFVPSCHAIHKVHPRTPLTVLSSPFSLATARLPTNIRPISVWLIPSHV